MESKLPGQQLSLPYFTLPQQCFKKLQDFESVVSRLTKIFGGSEVVLYNGKWVEVINLEKKE